jgi:hypothetical protein
MEVVRTERLLETLTDEGLFEKLAAAVLRDADPTYRMLAHPGVNADCKTVKSPVDGIGFVQGAKPPHMVIVHHTITARDGLENKWLHDPATVTPRGPKPTAPAGDVRKALTIAAEQRKTEPSLHVTLVLTTNHEPPEALIRKAHAVAAQANVELDVWTRARLAHFLDNTSQGQWIRRQYLGEEPQRLSLLFLQHLSGKSVAAFALQDAPQLWVERALDRALAERKRPGVTFLVAASGLGKSTACYKLLRAHIGAGGAGLILSQSVIATSLTLDGAIDATLSELQPDLASGAGSDALALCTPENPLLLIVEDINASGQAAALAEKIAGWDRRTDKPAETAPRPYRLICPIWPEMLGALQERSRKAVVDRALYAGSFAPEEGRLAVQRRAQEIGRIVSDMEADATAEALGYDPLLIALHDPTKKAASAAIIGDFIEGRIAHVAAVRRDYPAAKYRLALRACAAAGLKRRTLDPLWAELETWPELSDSERTLLGHLAGVGDVVRLAGASAKQRIAYRHDRVRDRLLIDAAADLAERDALPDEILAEPYYAEIFAGILANGIPTGAFLDRVKLQNPLALFSALGLLSSTSSIYQQVVSVIDSWLDGSQPPPDFWQLHWGVVQALAQTEAPDVVRLVNRLNGRGWQAMQARLRNGDIVGGIQLCSRLEPGTGAPWRDIQIDHAKQRFGANLVAKVAETLRSMDLDETTRIGLIRLAGHIADSALGSAIEVCWQNDPARDKHLADYLWAFAECCGEEPARFLKAVCDAWAALPAERDNSKPSPRDDLAAHTVRWAFQRWVPRGALPYFIKRAEADELRWPITFMLELVDDPTSIAFIIQEAAAIERRIEGTQSFSPFSNSLPRHWRERQERDGTGMSAASRDVAEKLWRDPDTEKYVRWVAFRLWAATHTDSDLQLLQWVDLPADLDDQILSERLQRGDRTATPALLARINGSEKNARWWWYQVKHIWSDDLLPVLDAELARRASDIKAKWQNGEDSDYQTSDLLMRLSPGDAEKLLTKYWSSLRYVSNFVQTALYIATPTLQDLVRTTMAECSEPDVLLKYIGQHIGLKTKGHPGITRPAQIAALAPYLPHFAKHEVEGLWEVCNSHGWFAERNALLDPYLRQNGSILYVDDVATFAALDEMRTQSPVYWLDHWLDRYGDTGASSADRMACVARWFCERKTMSALRLAADALVLIGRRADLALLDTLLADADADLPAIKTNTIFAVRRRTLA